MADIAERDVITHLGRGVIVGASADAPEPWSGVDRIVVDDTTLRDPAPALDALQQRWSQRIPVVVELRCSPDELRAPEAGPNRPAYALSPRFEFERERLYFLARANNYDHRVGRMVWGPAVEAKRLGAVDVEGADVALVDGTPVWCDGGPRAAATPVPPGHALVHRNNLEQGILTPDRAAAPSADLAADQLAAVLHDSGAARVIAPAGSGKTRVLTERFRLLVARGWSEGSITAVAYNVRAKDTMRARLDGMPERTQRRVRTLHALGNDVLRRDSGSTALIDEWEMRRRIEALVPVKPRANTDMYAPYLEALGEVRLGLVDPHVVEAQRDDVAGFGAMFDEYRDKLHADRAIDHDEQIFGAIEVLLRAPELRRAFQREARHLLVDEFQDLTPAQLLLLRLVGAPGYDVFGVGDDDQVIYGYAGADPEFLINYDRYFPGGAHHALATNYRCPARVVEVTRNLLSYNRRRIDKEIVAAKSGAAADELAIVTTPPEQLAAAAVGRVTSWLAAGARPDEIAVLSRVNSVLLPTQLLLGEAAVPCWTPVSVAVLNRTGTRTALAYLRLAVAVGDDAAFHGSDLAVAARRPSRSLRREVLQRFERKRQWRLPQLRRESEALSGTAAAKFDMFCDELEALGRAASGNATTAELLTRVRDDIGLGAALATLDLSGKSPDASHRDDLNALIAVATNEPEPAAFEPWLRTRLRGANEPASAEGVAVSTVHRVKGMEWPYIVVLGAHDGLMPHALADDIEEERRIFHVAITRADTAVHVLADATARRPFLDELAKSAPAEPAPREPARGVETPAAAEPRLPARPRGRTTIDAEVGLEVTFAGSTGPIVELRVDAAVLEEHGGTRVVIPYGERVERDGRRAQLVRGRSTPVTHASPQLVEALKAWRRQRAASDRVPAYIVLSDAHLEGIADRRPESLADLAGCTGIGPTKLERYGDEIIAVIADTPTA